MPDGSVVDPTGKPVTLRGCVIVEDGKVISQRAYYDNVEFMSQLGLE